MITNVSTAEGAVLDYLVAKARGWEPVYADWLSGFVFNKTADLAFLSEFQPSVNWSQGGPITEEDCIAALPPDGHRGGSWHAFHWEPTQHDLTFDDAVSFRISGPTELIAKMRCYVISKLGAEVDVPDELV